MNKPLLFFQETMTLELVSSLTGMHRQPQTASQVISQHNAGCRYSEDVQKRSYSAAENLGSLFFPQWVLVPYQTARNLKIHLPKKHNRVVKPTFFRTGFWRFCSCWRGSNL